MKSANTFSHQAFPPARLAAEREQTVSVCLPARDEERTIGPILEQLIPLRELGAIDQLVVVDRSTDATARIARTLGVEVHDQEALVPEHGPVLGKGDAMWRALPVLTGDVICFLDADSERFGAHFACGLLGPLLCEHGISFVKGFYRRPFRVGETVVPDGGGRVTELTARPLLNLFYPELAGVRQPLAGEIAARRELLERLPFVTGYGPQDSKRSRRSTSMCARTRTSRCVTSARWHPRSCRRSPPGWSVRVGCAARCRPRSCSPATKSIWPPPPRRSSARRSWACERWREGGCYRPLSSTSTVSRTLSAPIIAE